MSVERRARVAERVRGVLAEAIAREIRDPRVGFVTLTAVELSPDLHHATVFVSALGDDRARADALSALDRAAPFLRRLLARRAGLRHTPSLRFTADRSLERGARVEHLLDSIARERDDGAPDDDGSDR